MRLLPPAPPLSFPLSQTTARCRLQVLGTPTREEIHAMNPNYTEFKFPQIKAHPWTKVFSKRMPPDAVDLVSGAGSRSPACHCHSPGLEGGGTGGHAVGLPRCTSRHYVAAETHGPACCCASSGAGSGAGVVACRHCLVFEGQPEGHIPHGHCPHGHCHDLPGRRALVTAGPNMRPPRPTHRCPSCCSTRPRSGPPPCWP